MRRLTGGVEYLTPLSALGRVAAGVPAILNGGRFFDRAGERVQCPGERYASNGVRLAFEYDPHRNERLSL
jgi:hypothetical protein